MKILITGAAGYLGGVLLKFFYEKRHQVAGFDIREPNTSPGKFYLGDITLSGDVRQAVLDFAPEVIIHCAGKLCPGKDLAGMRAINVSGAENVGLAAKQSPETATIINLSSASVYGPRREERNVSETVEPQPTYAYAIQKLSAERSLDSMLAHSPVRVVHMRIPTVVGPSYRKPQGFLGVVSSLPVIPLLGSRSFQVLHEADLCFAVEAVMQSEVVGVVNVPSLPMFTAGLAKIMRKRTIPASARLVRLVMAGMAQIGISKVDPASLGTLINPPLMTMGKLAPYWGAAYSPEEAIRAGLIALKIKK